MNENHHTPEHPRSLSINDFMYELPQERIAVYPLAERDASRLLVYQDGDIRHTIFRQLPEIINPGDCLVFNDTKVIHARLYFEKSGGGFAEILCLEPVDPVEITVSFQSKKRCTWKVMTGNAKRWKIGDVMKKTIPAENGQYTVLAELVSKDSEGSVVQFSWEADKTFADILDDAGILPLPPYLNRDAESDDEERYQTVYARADGSVAAPTAGLHFTGRVFDSLKANGVRSVFLTLHVGAGTFKPVKSATMADHAMHQEKIELSAAALDQIRSSLKDNRVIAVGTTSLRTLESVYWFGVKLLSGQNADSFFVEQWEPYTLARQDVSATESLEAVVAWLNERKYSMLSGHTRLLIAPGYNVRMVDALITNFHQPQSTLLLLVSALIGDDWRRVYEYALNNDFRFLSFGDSSILFTKRK